jgi:diguanylate cyclase (GGDEF)-like protein
MPPNSRQPIRVLVVDDEAPVREAYRQILSEAIPSADRTALQDVRARLFPKRAGDDPHTTPQPRTSQFMPDFCDGAEAAIEACKAALAEKKAYSVVFLDMRMPPGPDGVWAAEQIRALDRDVEIVICTAFSDVDPAAISARVPPEDKLFYLQKPFHPHEVRQMALALGQKWTAERRITRLAFYDGLTGLPNRASFVEELAATIEAAKADGSKFAVLYFDLDNFKRINDTLGHGVGDELLRAMADRLSGLFRQADVIGRPTLSGPRAEHLARLGGDEFVVLVKNLGTPEDAGVIAQRVVDALLEPMQLSLHQILVTPSVGLAIYPTHGTDVETLFRNADLAMYFAKRQGPAQVEFFSQGMTSNGLSRLTLENKLHDALRLNEFTLQYQPQFDLPTGGVSGFEALLRWTNAELGSVPPAEFIPIAEETGTILPIGEWVLRTACVQMQSWRNQGLTDGRISVNVSGSQFAQRNFPSVVAAVLEESGLPPSCLELEVTESMVMRDEDRARRAFTELKKLGVLIAIDDFGTGYSSLTRLREFAVDRLKIDQSFVSDMQTNPENSALVCAIIKMAQALNVSVVAEGVEDLAQLVHLQDEQCDTAQGYLLGHPLPPSEIEALLQRLLGMQEASRTKRLQRVIEGPHVVNLK